MKNIIELNNISIRYWVAYSEDGENTFESLTLEISMNKSASNYGLLGIRLLNNNLDLEKPSNICISDNSKIYESEITSKKDLFTGLPEEYNIKIKNSINYFVELNNYYVKNRFVIYCSAHSEVGSSPFVFATLATIIMEILFDNGRLSLEEAISKTVLKSGFFKA